MFHKTKFVTKRLELRVLKNVMNLKFTLKSYEQWKARANHSFVAHLQFDEL
jgi:hypothetical protein